MLIDGYKFYENNDGLFRVKDGIVERYEDVGKWVANDEYSEGLLSMDEAFDYNATDSIDDKETLNRYIETCDIVYQYRGSDKITEADYRLFKIYTPSAVKNMLGA